MMIAILNGTLAGVKLNTPKPGQDFPPNQTLGLVQVTPEGDVETVRIKDENLHNKYDTGKPFSCKAAVSYWQNGNRSGVSVKLLEKLPSGKA